MKNKKPLSLPPFTTMLGYVGNILSSWFQKKSPGKVPIYDFEDLPTSSVCLYDDKGLLVAFSSRNNQLRVAKGGTRESGRSLRVARKVDKESRRSHPYRKPKSVDTQAAPEADKSRPPKSGRATRKVDRQAHPSQSYRKAIRSDEPVPIIPQDPEWDGWPDGDFSALFSMSFVEKHDNLHVHWATQILGGRAGDTDAAVWKDGKLTRRQCQGIIQCESVDCSMVTRPQTRKAGVENQLSKLCICGSRLVHLACKVRSTLHTFSGGVYYQNGGTHDHPRPTVRLHLAKEERDEFAAIVREQPKTGPLKLVVGRPTASGPAQSVAKISPLLVNADRVKYERQKVLRGSGGHGGDHFLSEFAKIEASNPNFIRSSQFGLVSVIVMQTPFLASRLIKAVLSSARRMSPYTFNAGFPA
ncbi:hypothetical protein B0H14DRAFT_3896312 [Mycena olivaceomarginata]|nr:hypothetical protein B0H14DRAFT_3896312 [Mycena olivaceomarginata]